MVPNYRHLNFMNTLIGSVLIFCAGTKLQMPLRAWCQIADTFKAKSTKLQTPLKLKVPNYRHLYCEKCLKAGTFKAKGAKLQTPLRFTSQLFDDKGTKLQTPFKPEC